MPIKWKKMLTNAYKQYATIRAKILISRGRFSRLLPAGSEPVLSIVVAVNDVPAQILANLIKAQNALPKGLCELLLLDYGSTSQPTIVQLVRAQSQSGIIVQRSIAQNTYEALEQAGKIASGEFITYLPGTDCFTQGSLRRLISVLQHNTNIDLLYWDDCVLHAPEPLNLKPAWDPIYLRERDYIGTKFALRQNHWRRDDFWKPAIEAIECYALLLAATVSIPEQRIAHLPLPLTQSFQTSSATGPQVYNQQTRKQTYLSLHLAQEGRDAAVGGTAVSDLFRVMYQRNEDEWPHITIIIPNKNQPSMIRRLLSQLLDQTDYPKLSVIVVDNDSTDPQTVNCYNDYFQSSLDFKVIPAPGEFNFSKSINLGLDARKKGHVLLLNNDVEVISSNWIKEMVHCFGFQNVGIVGAKLLFPNDTIQHAGVWVGFRNLAGHAYYKKPANFGGYRQSLKCRRSVQCVTGAVMLISEDCVEVLGPWNETEFAVAYNDVDYCLRAHDKGFRLAFTPFAELYHHESTSRSVLKSVKDKARFRQEKAALRKIHQVRNRQDPSFHPAMSRWLSTPFPKPIVSRNAVRRWYS